MGWLCVGQSAEQPQNKILKENLAWCQWNYLFPFNFFFSPLNWPGTRYEVTQRRFLNENPFTFNGKWCTPVPSVPMLTSGIRQGLFTGGRRRELKACSMPGPTASPVADGHGFGLRNPCLLDVLGLTSLRQVGGEGCGLQIHWDRKMLLPKLSPRVMSLEAAEWHYL